MHPITGAVHVQHPHPEKHQHQTLPLQPIPDSNRPHPNSPSRSPNIPALNQYPTTLFEAARPPRAQTLAPSVSGVTSTTSRAATAPPPSTVEKPWLAEAKTADLSVCPLAHPYVRTGSDLLDAQQPTTLSVTSVPDAQKRVMEFRTALEHRSRNALTPYKHDTWAAALLYHNLTERYPALCHSIQFGFDAGIRIPSCTYTPPNSTSLDEFSAAYHDIESKEFKKG
jgi:hypothetical protein